jgi:MoaA/NifB/PqqE/SkfB family radical SAM enzyme
MQPQDRGDISYKDAKRIVSYWADGGLKNIRFSGGEPTLWPGLDKLVSFSQSKGLQRIALSTNGSASLDYHKRLAGCGVNDFSISLDACCASKAEKMAGRQGFWNALVENIQALSVITYTTVGVVLTPDNANDVSDIIRFASNLGVADIRIISAAQSGSMLTVPDVAVDVLAKYPILKYRIENMRNGRGCRGLADTDNRRCPLVLDDMAVLNGKHYPCIIYLREQGDPIGAVGKHARRERLLWFATHDCQKDPICKKNCLDVCIDYNNKWRELCG